MRTYMWPYGRVLRSPDTISDGNTGADSSSASGDKTGDSPPPKSDENKSLAEIVQGAAQQVLGDSSTQKDEEGDEGQDVEKDEPDNQDTPPDGTDETPPDEGKKDDEAPPTDKEGDDKLPFNNHPRFKEVIKEKNDLKAKVDELAPFAESGKSILEYCQANEISDEDFSEALQMAALLKKNPAEFATRISSLLEDMNVALGKGLPADLQKKVDDGHMSAEDAKELAQLRVTKKTQEADSKRNASRSVQQTTQAVTSALNKWEESKVKGDADWKHIAKFVADRFQVLTNSVRVGSPEDAIRLAEQAYNEVRKSFPRASAKGKPPRKTLSPNGSSVNQGEDFSNDDLRTALPKLAQQVLARHRT